MKKTRFGDLLEICLDRLDRGESLPDILESYPDQEKRLKPILLIAMLSRALPKPAPRHTSIRTGMNYLITEMDHIQAAGGFRKVKPERTLDRTVERWLESLPNPFSPEQVSGLKLSYRLAIITLVVVMSGGFLTLSASASGLSGNVFTNLKCGLERVRSVLLYNPPAAASVFENEEFPAGKNVNRDEIPGIGLDGEFLPPGQIKIKNENQDPESVFVFDMNNNESIKELKEIERSEKKAEKDAEKEAKKLAKEAEKEEKKGDKKDKKDKKEKTIKTIKVKPEKDKKDKKK